MKVSAQAPLVLAALSMAAGTMGAAHGNSKSDKVSTNTSATSSGVSTMNTVQATPASDGVSVGKRVRARAFGKRTAPAPADLVHHRRKPEEPASAVPDAVKSSQDGGEADDEFEASLAYGSEDPNNSESEEASLFAFTERDAVTPSAKETDLGEDSDSDYEPAAVSAARRRSLRSSFLKRLVSIRIGTETEPNTQSKPAKQPKKPKKTSSEKTSGVSGSIRIGRSVQAAEEDCDADDEGDLSGDLNKRKHGGDEEEEDTKEDDASITLDDLKAIEADFRAAMKQYEGQHPASLPQEPKEDALSRRQLDDDSVPLLHGQAGEGGSGLTSEQQQALDSLVRNTQGSLAATAPAPVAQTVGSLGNGQLSGTDIAALAKALGPYLSSASSLAPSPLQGQLGSIQGQVSGLGQQIQQTAGQQVPSLPMFGMTSPVSNAAQQAASNIQGQLGGAQGALSGLSVGDLQALLGSMGQGAAAKLGQALPSSALGSTTAQVGSLLQGIPSAAGGLPVAAPSLNGILGQVQTTASGLPIGALPVAAPSLNSILGQVQTTASGLPIDALPVGKQTLSSILGQLTQTVPQGVKNALPSQVNQATSFLGNNLQAQIDQQQSSTFPQQISSAGSSLLSQLQSLTPSQVQGLQAKLQNLSPTELKEFQSELTSMSPVDQQAIKSQLLSLTSSNLPLSGLTGDVKEQLGGLTQSLPTEQVANTLPLGQLGQVASSASGAFGQVSQTTNGAFDQVSQLTQGTPLGQVSKDALGQVSQLTKGNPLNAVTGLAQQGLPLGQVTQLAEGTPIGGLASSLPVGQLAQNLPLGQVTQLVQGTPIGGLASSLPVGQLAQNLPLGGLANQLPSVGTGAVGSLLGTHLPLNLKQNNGTGVGSDNFPLQKVAGPDAPAATPLLANSTAGVPAAAINPAKATSLSSAPSINAMAQKNETTSSTSSSPTQTASASSNWIWKSDSNESSMWKSSSTTSTPMAPTPSAEGFLRKLLKNSSSSSSSTIAKATLTSTASSVGATPAPTWSSTTDASESSNYRGASEVARLHADPSVKHNSKHGSEVASSTASSSDSTESRVSSAPDQATTSSSSTASPAVMKANKDKDGQGNNLTWNLPSGVRPYPAEALPTAKASAATSAASNLASAVSSAASKATKSASMAESTAEVTVEKMVHRRRHEGGSLINRAFKVVGL